MKLIWFLPLLFVFLFGIINLFGIDSTIAARQLRFFFIGIALFFVFRKINIQFFRLNSHFFYGISLLFLLVTDFIGFEAKGSTRWVNLYLFQIQPSEIFKIFYIIFIAQFFSTFKPHASKLRLFLTTLLLTLIPCFLIYKQPDLASAVIVFIIYLVMAVHSPIYKKHLILFFIGVVVLMPLFWLTLHDYQKARIYSFISPKNAIMTSSYNMNQAIIAVGSGGMFGRGLGMGKQSTLSFLPERHTDFAFSALIEQFGFIGGVVLIVLYGSFFVILFTRLSRMISKRDEYTVFHFYYTLGFSAFIISQCLINIGMNIGLLPIAGITLPFVSYGGSSLISLLFGLAFLP